MPIPAETLNRAGIRLSPSAFEALVERLVEQLARERPTPLADDRLPESEAAALRRAGLVGAPGLDQATDSVAELAAAHAALVATSLTVKEAARRLRVDPSRVRQRLHERTLYGFKLRDEWRLPAFQFGASGSLPGLEIVAPRLSPGLHPVAVQRWFALPCPDLEVDERPVSPSDWLRAGGPPAPVAAIAAELV